MTKMLLALLAVTGMLYVGALGWLYAKQRNLIYPAPLNGAAMALSAGEGVRAVQLTTTDGLVLRALYRPPQGGRPTVLFFHGNGDSLAGSRAATVRFAAQGYGLLLLEHRGYAGNPGTPSEEGLYRDGAAALRWLASQGTPPSRTILIGNSLGSGVATEMAATHRVAGLVLVSGFTSLADVVRVHYPFVPVRWLLHDRYDNQHKLQRVSCPILILHGAADPLIPAEQGRVLSETKASARLEIVPEAGHELVYTDASQDRTAAWLRTLFP
ncbi:alpha/beta hydrolase [Sphingomonas sp.]|uniref:alpha/beta hydrolase n=1 Tax=Sphingomonas sp. TaxID=28214 RepID=UPI003B3B68B8